MKVKRDEEKILIGSGTFCCKRKSMELLVAVGNWFDVGSAHLVWTKPVAAT